MLYDDYSNEGNHKTLHFLEEFYDLLEFEKKEYIYTSVARPGSFCIVQGRQKLCTSRNGIARQFDATAGQHQHCR